MDSQTVHQRLEELMLRKKYGNCYSFSKSYRDLFPHNTDFKLIMSTFTDYEAKMGIPHTERNEMELCEYKPEITNDKDINPESLLNFGNRYSDRIISKLMNHIKRISSNQKKNEWATNKVRKHITSMAHLVPGIVRTIISKNLMMEQYSTQYELVRVYGEPFLPNTRTMRPFLKKFAYATVRRSERIYNLLTVEIPAANLTKVMSFDGTQNFGTKFVIRPSNSKKLGDQLKEIRNMISDENLNT